MWAVRVARRGFLGAAGFRTAAVTFAHHGFHPEPPKIPFPAMDPTDGGVETGADKSALRRHHSLNQAAAGKRTVLVLFTGGTVGMEKRVEDGALAPRKGFVSQRLAAMEDLRHPDMPQIYVEEWDPALDSSDMDPTDWVRMARVIRDHYYEYDGFVVIHGTDTMAYTASALSFLLVNLNKPVIVTGAMISLAEVYNDAKRNLVMSLLIAAQLDIPEVCIFFNNQLLRGNRSTKMDSWSVGAFESPNFPILATAGTTVSVNYSLILPQPKSRFRIATELLANVIVLTMNPAFDPRVLEAIAESTKGQRCGLVCLLFGTGNAPTRNGKFVSALEKCVASGMEVAISTQCPKGRVILNSYATGKSLQSLGVIDAKDMTVEACVTKLSYLLGVGLRGPELRSQMEENLRGELSDQVGHHDLVQSTTRL